MADLINEGVQNERKERKVQCVLRERERDTTDWFVKEHGYPQHWNFILFMSDEEGQTCQRLLQIFPQDLHSLSRGHFFMLLILILCTERRKIQNVIK